MLPPEQARILKASLGKGIYLRSIGEGALSVSLDEATTLEDVLDILKVFAPGPLNFSLSPIGQPSIWARATCSAVLCVS